MNLIDGRADKDVEAFIQESHEFGECQHKVKYFDTFNELLTGGWDDGHMM